MSPTPDRSLRHEDQPADEVIHHVLATEAHADRDGSAGDGKGCQRDIRGAQCEKPEEHHEKVKRQSLERANCTGFDTRVTRQQAPYQRAESSGSPHTESENDQCSDQHAQRHGLSTDREELRVPDLPQLVPHTRERFAGRRSGCLRRDCSAWANTQTKATLAVAEEARSRTGARAFGWMPTRARGRTLFFCGERIRTCSLASTGAAKVDAQHWRRQPTGVCSAERASAAFKVSSFSRPRVI